MRERYLWCQRVSNNWKFDDDRTGQLATWDSPEELDASSVKEKCRIWSDQQLQLFSGSVCKWMITVDGVSICACANYLAGLSRVILMFGREAPREIVLLMGPRWRSELPAMSRLEIPPLLISVIMIFDSIARLYRGGRCSLACDRKGGRGSFAGKHWSWCWTPTLKTMQ